MREESEYKQKLKRQRDNEVGNKASRTKLVEEELKEKRQEENIEKKLKTIRKIIQTEERQKEMRRRKRKRRRTERERERRKPKNAFLFPPAKKSSNAQSCLTNFASILHSLFFQSDVATAA